MIRMKKPSLEEMLTDYDEFIYLKYNKDVKNAVDNGTYTSGLQHFKLFGFKEGRIFTDQNSHFLKDYEALIRKKMDEHPNNIDLAMMQSIGSESAEAFHRIGNLQVEILRHLGLKDNMTLYDLGCGCGRTSQALIRSGWKGNYTGADIMPPFISYAKNKSPTHNFIVHRDLSIKAPDASLDLVIAWSVFTHLRDEEIYIYMADIFRSLKSGGLLIFSFLEHASNTHETLFLKRVEERRNHYHSDHLDNFIHRDFIKLWISTLGFSGELDFLDDCLSEQLSQSLAIIKKR